MTRLWDTISQEAFAIPAPVLGTIAASFVGLKGIRFDMKELELFTGTGTLLVDSRELGAASYEIVPGSVGTTAHGELTADPLALEQAASARSITLRLADGTELEITITRVDRDRAEIKIKPPAKGSSEL